MEVRLRWLSQAITQFFMDDKDLSLITGTEIPARTSLWPAVAILFLALICYVVSRLMPPPEVFEAQDSPSISVVGS